MAKTFSLPGGSYSVIPSTYSPGAKGEFYLRVFTESSRDGAEAESGLRSRSTENVIDSEDEDRNTTVIQDEERNTTVLEEDFEPQQKDEDRNTTVLEEELVSQKDERKDSRVNIRRKPGEENQVIRIKTDFTEITIRVVERQK